MISFFSQSTYFVETFMILDISKSLIGVLVYFLIIIYLERIILRDYQAMSNNTQRYKGFAFVKIFGKHFEFFKVLRKNFLLLQQVIKDFHSN
jgi:hypothetical protein